MFHGLFQKKVPPDEMVKEWRAKVKAEGRNVDREIRQLERTEERTKLEVKKLAKLGEVSAARLLAKELIAAKKAKERMYETKARLNSVQLQLAEQLAQVKMTQAISQSAEAMAAMNALVNVPIMSATMRTLAREMEKAGFIQEMVEDTLGGEELSDEADEEIDKVFAEITAGIDLPAAGHKTGEASKTGTGTKVPAKVPQ